jgi:rare lipoprotein A
MNAIRRSDNGNRPRRFLTFAGAILATILGVAGAQAASPTERLNPQIVVSHHHWYQLGVASWYGKFFQGRTTASGEPYDENQLTCAHRTLPLGSVLRVTNLRNNRSVIVTVNDRGPVPESRVIDLSHAAAETLGFSDSGLAPVKVELIGPSSELAQLLMPAGLEPPR